MIRDGAKAELEYLGEFVSARWNEWNTATSCINKRLRVSGLKFTSACVMYTAQADGNVDGFQVFSQKYWEDWRRLKEEDICFWVCSSVKMPLKSTNFNWKMSLDNLESRWSITCWPSPFCVLPQSIFYSFTCLWTLTALSFWALILQYVWTPWSKRWRCVRRVHVGVWVDEVDKHGILNLNAKW